jgi:hypothetical protein
MSGSGDRIAVPTNGHHKPLSSDALEAPAASAVGVQDRPGPGQGGAPGGSDRPLGEGGSPAGAAATPEVRIALTPTQAAIGFGIVASLVLFLLGRRRRSGR